MDDKAKLEKYLISLEDLSKDRPDIWEKYKENFKCPKDPSIEEFLKVKSERSDKYEDSKTHLILDSKNMKDNILAYFSLSFIEIPIDDKLEVSNTLLRKLHGSGKPASLKGFFITQLGKNFFPGNPIKLPDIFEEIYTLINDVRKKVGGRLIFLDCKDNPALIRLYEENGFKLFKRKKSAKGEKLVVMFKAIEIEVR